MGRKGQNGEPSEARKAKMRARAAAFQLQQAQAAADAQAQALAAADAQAQTAAQPSPQLQMSSNAEAMDLTSSTNKQTKGTFGSKAISTSSASLGNPERKDVGTQT